MSGRYHAYPEYKNSGVRFFNYIPQHWTISKVRFISSFGRGLAITKANLKDKGIPCVSYGEVHSKFGFEVDPKKHNLKCVDEEYLKISPDALLSKGDFVFADTSEDIDGSGNFTQLVSDEILFAGYHTVVVRPTSDNYYRFLAYVFDSPEYRTQVRDAVKGVKVFSVTQAILKNTNVWLPTYEEQQKIANFLDHETAKIDILIAKQEKLIDLLKEKRQAVISHAVTRGLNPNASMKYSGVEWLGDVPEHWKTSKIRFDFAFDKGLTITKANLVDKGVPCVNYGEIHSKFGFEVDPKTHHLKCVNESYLKSNKSSLLNQGDIVFADTSEDLEGAGNFTQLISDEKVFAGYHTIITRSIKSCETRFIAYLFDSVAFRKQIQYAVKGVKVFSITQAILKNTNIWYPNKTEQKEISEYLDLKTSKIDLLIGKANKAIFLIKERKTALISAAVTGKIDVRNYNTEKAGD